MNVEPSASLNHHLHITSLITGGDRDAAGMFKTLPSVLPVPEGDKE
jgi:hypothetical protein